MAVFLIVGIGAMAVAQVQTPSATLSTVIQKIQENPYVPEKQQAVLAAFFAAAVEQGELSPEQALALLEAVGWDELQEDLGFAVRALELALIALTAGDMTYEEVLAALTEGLKSLGQAGASLPGLFVALTAAGEGMSPDFWGKVEELVLDKGVPPGIVARTIRQYLRSGASEGEILEALEALGEEVSAGMPPGKAANKASSLGCKEKEKPCPPEVRGNHQNHEEEGSPQDDDHGKSHGHGKGKGSGKGKGKGKGKKS